MKRFLITAIALLSFAGLANAAQPSHMKAYASTTDQAADDANAELRALHATYMANLESAKERYAYEIEALNSDYSRILAAQANLPAKSNDFAAVITPALNARASAFNEATFTYNNQFNRLSLDYTLSANSICVRATGFNCAWK